MVPTRPNIVRRSWQKRRMRLQKLLDWLLAATGSKERLPLLHEPSPVLIPANCPRAGWIVACL